jgi:hypothetical protein
MATTFNYTKTANLDKLTLEIMAASLPLLSMSSLESQLTIVMAENLTEQQNLELDSIVNLHDAAPLQIIPDISPRQLRLALVLNNISLAQIDSALDQLEEPTKSLAKIEWEYATTFERNKPLVEQVGQLLGWNSQQLDDLWLFASTL